MCTECDLEPLNLDAIFRQPSFAPAPIREMLLDLDPEVGGMVWIETVNKLMDHDVLGDPRWQENGLPVERHPATRSK